MGTHLRALRKGFPMNTNMTGLWWFSKNLCISVLLTKIALSIGRVKSAHLKAILLEFLSERLIQREHVEDLSQVVFV